jgi:uncharacterized Fe-S cluster protein YjdI
MKTYPKEDIKIGWQAEKCTHSANCVKGLSAVFKPKDQPWIHPENASKQAIINQVAKCPSGALTIVH